MSERSRSPSTEREKTPRPKLQSLPPEPSKRLTITLPGGRASTPSRSGSRDTSVAAGTFPPNPNTSTSSVRGSGSLSSIGRSRRSTTPIPIPPAIRRATRSASRESTSTSSSTAIAPYARPDKGKARADRVGSDGSASTDRGGGRGRGRGRGRGGARGNTGVRNEEESNKEERKTRDGSRQESIPEEEIMADGNGATGSTAMGNNPMDLDVLPPVEGDVGGIQQLERILEELDEQMPLAEKLSVVKQTARSLVKGRRRELEEKYQEFERDTKAHYMGVFEASKLEYEERLQEQYRESMEQQIRQEKARIEEEINDRYQRHLAEINDEYKKSIEESIRQQEEEKYQARLQKFVSMVPDGWRKKTEITYLPLRQESANGFRVMLEQKRVVAKMWTGKY
ncbi:hypothetical protein CVT24_007003 [Panaeolus cyanescens]|uniref:Uncharacterized protein n=1 Tax=Panaeolus cyanescens TaxID=181874 RepID=A0A409YKG1_9AGAR|nr:hypothetical protein CVT24_007003 [Panaeolus cyanescens]